MRGSQIIVPLAAAIILREHVAPILLLLVLALLLASILSPLVNWLETRFGGSRLLAVLAIYVTIILTIVGAAYILGGTLYEQAETLVSSFQGKNLEDLINNLKESVLGFIPQSLRPRAEAYFLSMIESPPEFLSKLAGGLGGIILKLADVVGKLVLVLVFTFILLLESRNFKVAFVRAVPNAYFEMVLNLLEKIHKQVSGYLRGQGMAALTVGVLSTIGLFLISQLGGIALPYFVIIGMLAGLANLIPFIGPFVGMVPAIAVYLMTPQPAGINAIMIVVIIVMFLSVQAIDNFFVSPKIMSASVGMHPLVVIVVIMIGGSIMGPLGMLFAVPAFGVLKVTVVEVVWGLKAYRIL
ncbi:MAG: AI-2E family transporter [Fidelibacterota bacterium]|nr:MAG: AI-2E family transporter [Candidatus Neomarinimicrobiota bacterium]